MKRILLFLLVALLLAGCNREPVPTDPTNPPPQTEETKSLYVPESNAEQQTEGAVLSYTLGKDTYSDIRALGNHLLLVGKKNWLVLSGEEGKPLASLSDDAFTSVQNIDTTTTGAAYYIPNNRQVVILNPQLQKVTQIELPKTIVDTPVISLARNEVFYSAGSEIRAWNITTGISRLLRKQSSVTYSLLGHYFDSTVLLCRITDESGKVRTEYISAETGQTLRNAEEVVSLHTFKENYFAFWQDGTMLQSVFGDRKQEPKSFSLPYPADSGGRAAVPEMNGVVNYVLTEEGLTLSFYELQDGKLTAQVTLPGVGLPTKVFSDGKYVWFLTVDKENLLYRWDITKSPAADEWLHVGHLYTEENPDTEGLAQCREQATAYERKYGVKLVFWNDSLKTTGGHTVKVEYHPQVITQTIEKLIPTLAQFPERFLQKTVEAGWIRLVLVQSIEGGADWVQFWEKGDCWVILSVQGDVVNSLLQGMAYGIDSHIIGNSRDFDGWNDLNPEGFVYSPDNTAESGAAYLDGEARAFTDAAAMRYPHEDRCRIFYNAMLPDNQEMFTSPIMKEKLLRVCTGIREAYNLEKKTVDYPWEQYLDSSIAYVEKK